MELKELRQFANIERVFVIHIDENGHELRNELIVLPSQIAKYDEEEVVRVEATLETSNPNIDGTIQVSPCLKAWVLTKKE